MGYLSEASKNLLLALAVPGLYCLMLLIGRRLKRVHRVRLGWSYHLFSLSLAALVVALVGGLGGPFLPHLIAVVATFGTLFLLALVDRYLWERHFKEGRGVDVPRFVTEIVRLAVLIIALFLVLTYVYGQTVRGLLIAPGLAALITGFALQDLLGNIIAGVSLQIGKPFVKGDWLILDHQHAEVVEINWRSTRLRTTDEIVIEIPNRQIANATVTNLSRPTRRHAMRLSIGIDYGALPTRVKEVLVHAAANAKGVLPEPEPKAFLKNFGDSSIEYEIKFWLEDHSQYSDICDAIRTNAWYELRRQGIRLPFPTRTVQIERPAPNRQAEVHAAARTILRQQPLFRSLTDGQLDALLPRSRVLHFGRGEKLIEQGANGDSMFILMDGEANVLVDRNEVKAQVASLKSGDCFGEMSLLTGERRRATVIANTDCEVVEIAKPVLANLLKEFPELLDKLSELLAHRELENEGIVAAQSRSGLITAKQTEYKANVMSRLRKFFEL
jgi:small-conductance mechanosensitive channel/CRP-like cAMP-binding protein